MGPFLAWYILFALKTALHDCSAADRTPGCFPPHYLASSLASSSCIASGPLTRLFIFDVSRIRYEYYGRYFGSMQPSIHSIFITYIIDTSAFCVLTQRER